MATVYGAGARNNNIANAILSKKELAAFIAKSADNAISFAVNRNPRTVYQFIKQNYGKDYPNVMSGGETNYSQMESMHRFLLNKYNNLPAAAQPHFLANLLHSLPKQAQLKNWTTPVEDQQ